MQKFSAVIMIGLFIGLAALGLISRETVSNDDVASEGSEALKQSQKKTPVLTEESDTNVALNKKELVKVLEKKLPGVAVQSIEKSPLAGFYQVFFDGQLIYVNENGQFLFTGNLLELTKGNPVNHSQLAMKAQEAKMEPLRAQLISEVKESDMVVFRAKDEKHVITVFTDIDCGYCRKLHTEVKDLNDLGVTVRYMAFPRAGINSDSYKKLVSVWCADDRQAAMDNAKLKRQFTDKSCENPIADQFHMTKKFNLSGTPTLILSDGELIGGYVPAAQLIARLNEKANSAVKISDTSSGK